jgi:hypothetical protein
MPQGPIVVAPYLKSASGQALAIADKQGSQLVSQLHGEKYQQAYLQNLFLGANVSGQTTSAGLNAAYTGLVLINPAGNIKNLVMRRVAGQFIVAPAALLGVNLITGYSVAGVVTFGALTPASTIIGGAAVATAELGNTATLVGTPAWTLPLAQDAASAQLPFFSTDLEGAIILPPGAYAAIGTTVAGPANGLLGYFEWEEVPV